MRSKQYPSHLVDQVRELYSSGMTQSEVGVEVGVSQKVVWNLMRRHNITTRTAAKRDQSGPRNHMWKGSAASYQAKHLRVQKTRGKPQRCEVCQTTDTNRSYDWANVNGDFDDIEGFVRMCRSCHWKHDGTINNIPAMRERGSPEDAVR